MTSNFSRLYGSGRLRAQAARDHPPSTTPLQVRFSRECLAKKISDRFRIDDEILYPNLDSDGASSSKSTKEILREKIGLCTSQNDSNLLLALPDEILGLIFEAIDDAASQITFALSCKTAARFAATQNLSLAESKPVPTDYKCGDSYYYDPWKSSRTNREIRDNSSFVHGIDNVRTRPSLRDGIFTDVPKLMHQLRSWIPGRLRLCTHCMCYRPKSQDYWLNVSRLNEYPIGTDWKEKLMYTDDWVPGYYSQEGDECPFCMSMRNFKKISTELQHISGCCPGCRMQVELWVLRHNEWKENLPDAMVELRV